MDEHDEMTEPADHIVEDVPAEEVSDSKPTQDEAPVAEETSEELVEMTEPTDERIEDVPAEEVPDSEPAEDEAPVDEEASEELLEAEQLAAEKMRAIVEALLLVSDRPLPVSRIKEVLGGIGAKDIREIVAGIQERLAEHGFPFQVREIGGGYVLSTLPEYAPWVQKLYAPKAKTSKLSQAALETLAVVAYKQPVTRGEMEAIRGVSVDSTLKTLLEKRLVEIAGYKDVVGKPATYETTNEFLLHFGLKSLSDLPSIEELRRPPDSES